MVGRARPPPSKSLGSAGASPSRLSPSRRVLDDAMTTPQSDGQPWRKHPAHGVIILPDQPTIVFVTVCAKDRKPWLATKEIHDLLRSVWIDARAWVAGRY